ncbi:MAG: GFA family protein [Gammaproteobacteria bacterium]|nr:GFA family protein [Gammaproteobacteria bacterium]
MRGKCLCGEIEFEIVGALPRLYQCHCSLCRKQGGSASNTALIIAAENFRWLAGETYISSYVKASGFRSDFCSQCGSPTPNPLRNTPYFWVPAGLLDNGDQLEIGAHLYVGSKASWDATIVAGAQYEMMPELSALIELLHSKTHA